MNKHWTFYFLCLIATLAHSNHHALASRIKIPRDELSDAQEQYNQACKVDKPAVYDRLANETAERMEANGREYDRNSTQFDSLVRKKAEYQAAARKCDQALFHLQSVRESASSSASAPEETTSDSITLQTTSDSPTSSTDASATTSVSSSRESATSTSLASTAGSAAPSASSTSPPSNSGTTTRPAFFMGGFLGIVTLGFTYTMFIF